MMLSSFSSWKFLTIRKLLYLPRILTGAEKRFFFLAALVVAVSGGIFFARIYGRITIPLPDVGNSYTEGMIGEPQMINPLYAVRDTDRDMARLTFAGLLRYRSDGSVETDLAERYEISSDGKMYTFTLRPSLEWHDGKPLTADDVLFTVYAIQNALYRSPLRINWQGVTAEKLNDKTIRFTLRAPYAPFIENLTLGILPMHVWESVSAEQTPLHEANLKPIGSGPYRFYSLKQNKDGSIPRYSLTRNTRYHGQGPFIKKLTFVFYKTEADLFAAWRRGAIEGFGGISQDRMKEINRDNMRLLSLATPRMFGLFFNQRQSSLLKEFAVREAIARGIDKTRLTALTSPESSAIDNAPVSMLGATTAAFPLYPYDPEGARRLLAEHGWYDEDNDGIREKKIRGIGDVNIIPLRFILTTSDWPDLVHAADILKGMFAEIGIDTIIEKKTFPELEANVIRPRNFEMLLFGHVYGYEPDPFAFWHSSQIKDPGLNIASFGSKEADNLLEDARKTVDTTSRSMLYRQFSDIILKELPAVFLFTQRYFVLLPSDIQGVQPMKISLPSDRFNEINLWFRDTKRVLKWR